MIRVMILGDHGNNNDSSAIFGVLGGTKNGPWGARIKILRPLFNTNTPPKTPILTFWEPFWTPEK